MYVELGAKGPQSDRIRFTDSSVSIKPLHGKTNETLNKMSQKQMKR